MANNLNTNPISLDTFAADVVLSTRPISLKGAMLYSDVATDHICIKDKNGVECLHLLSNQSFDTSVDLNNPPYTVDVSEGAFDASARFFLYQ